jgi:hypothetical protein
MAKKERLGTDPFKGGSLGWIQDTREDKKAESKKEDKDDVKASKRQSVMTSKRLSTKTSRRQDVKALKRHDTNALPKRKHTVYLTPAQSKKLRVYAAANEMPISEVVEKLINDHI